jgi:hypothetical protein
LRILAGRDLRVPLSIIGVVWVAAILVLTWDLLGWHLSRYKIPGAAYYSTILIAAPVACILCIGYVFLRKRFPLPKYEIPVLVGFIVTICIFKEPLATLAAGGTWLATIALGGRLFRTLGLKPDGQLQQIALELALGLGCLICLLFAAGLVGLYKDWIALLLVLAPIVVWRNQVAKSLGVIKQLHSRWIQSEACTEPLVGVAVCALVPFSWFSVSLALTPSIAVDAVSNHLTAAVLYTHGQVLPDVLPHAYMYYPQGFEMLLTLGYLLQGQSAAQMISPIFFVTALVATAALGRQCGWSTGGVVFGVVAAAVMPFLHFSGSIVKNDLALAAFELTALSCYLAWRASKGFRWILLGGFLLAMSFGIKHTALFGAVPLGLLFASATWRQHVRVRAGLKLLFVVLIFAFFWHIRTYLLTGNPVYPEYASRTIEFGQPTAVRGYAFNPWRYSTILIDSQFNGDRAIYEGPLRSPMGIFLLAFLPLTILSSARPGSRFGGALALFSLVYLGYWSTVLRTIRYAAPAILVVAVFVGERITNVYENGPRLLRICIVGTAVYCFMFAALAAMLIEVNAPQLKYMLGMTNKDRFLNQAMAVYPAVKSLENHAKAGDLVLGRDCMGAVYAPEPWNYRCVESPKKNVFPDIRSAIRSGSYQYLVVPADLASELSQEGISGVEIFRDNNFVACRLQFEP